MYQQQIENYHPTCQQERSDKKMIIHYISTYPYNVLTRSNQMAHLTSSALIMNRDLTKVLMIYHKIYQSWGWTGGHMDGDDDCLKVAIKEAMEETGLHNLKPLSEHIMSIDVLPVWGHIKDEAYVSAHLHLNTAFVLIGDPSETLVVNEKETEGVMWVDVASIEDFSTEPDLNIVYGKLVNAAKAYDPNQVKVARETSVEPKGDPLFKVLKDTTIPIAVHEAKSAYYKAKLVKEVASRGSKAVYNGTKKLFKK